MKCFFCTWVDDTSMTEALWVVAGYSCCDDHIDSAIERSWEDRR